MQLIDGLDSVMLGSPDPEATARFYEQIVRLKVLRREDGVTVLSGSDSPWILVYAKDRDGGDVTRITYRAVSEAAVGELRDRVLAVGREVTNGTTPAGAPSIRFREPSGMELEVGYLPVAQAASGNGAVKLDRILHAVWYVADVVASERFCREVLGFLPSDWIEDSSVFMRAGNGYHHSLGLLAKKEKAGRLDHVCFLAHDIDDLMRIKRNAERAGIRFLHEFIRHEASGSVSTYFIDPLTNVAAEICIWHSQIADVNHQPRILPRSPATLDRWSAAI